MDVEKASGPLIACLCACLLAAVVAGCQRPGVANFEGQVDLKLDPSPPVVGSAAVSLSLADVDGRPLPGASVRLEGNMNHAGMQPTFADLREAQAGRYEGTLEFTMGGDWFVLVTARMPDGQTLEKKIDVPGVTNP